MEILGLDPYQSETQYLEEKFRVLGEWQQSGNKFPLNFHFVASTFPLDRCSGNKEEICFCLVASLFPLFFHLSNNHYLQQR